MTGAQDAWEAALDDFERDLRTIEAALATGLTPDEVTFALPRPSAPLPASLRGRAESLLERARDAEAALASSILRLRTMSGATDERTSRLFDTSL